MLSQRAEDRASVGSQGKPLGSNWPEEAIVRQYKAGDDSETWAERSAAWAAIEAKRDERLAKRAARTVRQAAPGTRSLSGALRVTDPDKLVKGCNLPDGSQKVAFFGGASVTLPKAWGQNGGFGVDLASRYLRFHRAERVCLKGKGYEIRIPSRPERLAIHKRECEEAERAARAEKRARGEAVAPKVKATGKATVKVEKTVDPFAVQADPGRSVRATVGMDDIAARKMSDVIRAQAVSAAGNGAKPDYVAPVRGILAF